MKPRDIVLEQLQHRETKTIPYSIWFEGDVQERLDQYYGSSEWKERMTSFIEVVSFIDPDLHREIKPGYTKDAFGSIWRMDVRPFHLEMPGLHKPDLAGYAFPGPEPFIQEDRREAAISWLRPKRCSPTLPWKMQQQSLKPLPARGMP